MKTFAFIFGRNPELSKAELFAVFGGKLQPAKNNLCAFFDGDLPNDSAQKNSAQDFLNKLGGTVEIVEIFKRGIEFDEIEPAIIKFLAAQAKNSSGKFTFGLNRLPETKNSSVLKMLLPRIKKALRAQGVHAANYTNKGSQNVSQVFAFKHNMHKNAANIWIIDDMNNRAALGFSVALQDFEAYSKRDYEKPFRDARLGMLPPKLAQIMINLGNRQLATGNCGGNWETGNRKSGTGKLTIEKKIFTFPCCLLPVACCQLLDPFCGTGTILMEAVLMGRAVIGCDTDARVCEGAQKNLEWLKKTFAAGGAASSAASSAASGAASSAAADAADFKIFQKDARLLTAQDLARDPAQNPCGKTGADSRGPQNIAVVTEPHLGPPLLKLPAAAELEKIIENLAALYLEFFGNLSKILPPGTPVVFVFPYFKAGKNEKIRVSWSLIEKIQNLGYTKTAFDLSQTTSLFYERPDQIVGREIVRFIKK